MAKIVKDWYYGRTACSLKQEKKFSRKVHKKECNRQIRHNSKQFWNKGCEYKKIIGAREYSHVT